jgi:superfamily II DNA/RNA helicase
VAEQLSAALGKKVTVRAVTGTLPPAERVARIEELAATPGQHVLVATDCLSEGVNLQENFQAVVHYDLAWNPPHISDRRVRDAPVFAPRAVTNAFATHRPTSQICRCWAA